MTIDTTVGIAGAYASLPYLKKSPGSLMFSTSSSSATYGMPRLAVYSATKHALEGYSESLDHEIRARQEAGYPPYGRLASLIVSATASRVVR